MALQEGGVYELSTKKERVKMQSPPIRTAIDLFLHMVDESYIIIIIKGHNIKLYFKVCYWYQR